LFLLITGKLNRGLSVVDSYKLLKGADDLSEEEMFLASTLGWCIEWVILFSSSSRCYSAE
jgi:farnesyl diphosphate synthase